MLDHVVVSSFVMASNGSFIVLFLKEDNLLFACCGVCWDCDTSLIGFGDGQSFPSLLEVVDLAEVDTLYGFGEDHGALGDGRELLKVVKADSTEPDLLM